MLGEVKFRQEDIQKVPRIRTLSLKSMCAHVLLQKSSYTQWVNTSQFEDHPIKHTVKTVFSLCTEGLTLPKRGLALPSVSGREPLSPGNVLSDTSGFASLGGLGHTRWSMLIM